MTNKHPITVAYGDGIGPEIMEAVLNILWAAEAPIRPEYVDVGEKIYLSGNKTGIPQSAWESLQRTKTLLKAPITTPQGGGYKSLNVTIRKSMGLYANIRPCRSLAPIVETKHPDMDTVIIRENEEDLYAGIEYRQTQGAYQCLKLITRHGSEAICQFAFDYARRFNRKRVTCMSKDNIMQMTDGLFHQVFNEVAAYYPDIKTDHYIIDIGTARIASRPEDFDMVVTENLYGDIISDIAAEIVGSVGLAGSANIGRNVAMFEAIHGSAPDIAGQGKANPSGLLNGAIMMLVHLGAYKEATLIENAWLKTLEDGIHTPDIYGPDKSQQQASTQSFAEAVIERLGQQPTRFRAADYQQAGDQPVVNLPQPEHQTKQLMGLDVFIDRAMCGPQELGDNLDQLDLPLKLQTIDNRGVQVWPQGHSETYCSDHWRCRFYASEDMTMTQQTIIDMLTQLYQAGYDIIKTENLYYFDNERGFSLGQGQS